MLYFYFVSYCRNSNALLRKKIRKIIDKYILSQLQVLKISGVAVADFKTVSNSFAYHFAGVLKNTY